MRLSYGAANGIAGRLTVMGPSATDQLGMLEIVYGCGRSWRTFVPVLSLGAGGAHTYIAGSGGPPSQRVRTRAWSLLLGGSAGVAARATDRAAILLDVHTFLADPIADAIVGGGPAAGRMQLLVGTSVGVVAGF
jgi:hypothetical protein